MYDSTAGCCYYLHNKTGDVQWEKPEDFEKPDYRTLGYSMFKRLMPPDVRAALTVQGIWRAKCARRALRLQRAAINPETHSTTWDGYTTAWTAIHDPSAGADYYHHSETGEQTWARR